MAYKRYFYKNGKVFGPYYYESYRDENGKVRKKYIGLVDPKKSSGKKVSGRKSITPTLNWSKKSFIILGGAIFLISLFVLIFSNFNLTGNVGLNVNSIYLSGENISGEFVLQVKEGELIPANAKFVVEQSGEVQEFLISDLLDSNSNGDFYIEGKNVFGSGSGYGFLGEKKIYPEIDFELIILDSENSGQRTLPEENLGQTFVDEILTEETPEQNIPEETSSQEISEIPQTSEQDANVPKSLPQKSEIENSQQGNSEINSETNSERSDQREISNEQTSEVLESQQESFGISITGAVINEENENVLKGKCSKESDFVYEIEIGKTAKIKSVELNGEKIDEKNIKLKIFGNQIIVSTDYSETKNGFGRDFLTDKEKKIKIDLDSLNIKAEQGEIVVKLVYEEEVLAEVREIVEVREIPIDNEEIESETIVETPSENETFFDETLIINETTKFLDKNETGITNQTTFVKNYTIPETEIIINETTSEINKTEIIENQTIIFNETEIKNQTFENQTTVNLTAETFITIQYQAMINQPVKWMKIINVSRRIFSDFVVEIPKFAENISVKKDNEIERAFKESQEIEAEKSKERKILMTGSTILENLQGAEIIETPDKKIINLTEIAETSQQVAVEYYTEAPVSKEIENGNKKQISISAPDELNYTNILAYTLVNENYKIKIDETDKLKLYWIVKKQIEKNITEIPEINETLNKTLNETFITNETNQTEIPSINKTPDENKTQEINLTNETDVQITNRTIPEINETTLINETIISNETAENETEIVVNETTLINETIISNETAENQTIENTTETTSENEILNETENQSENFEGSRFITGQVIGNGNFGFFNWLKKVFAKISWGLTGQVVKLVSAEETSVTNETSLSSTNQTIESLSIIVEKKEIIEKILVDYTAYDLDNDTYVDYIEWVVPHLSNQTYELIIEISKAEHLDSNRTFLEDVYEFVKKQDNNFTLIPSGNYLRITFEKNLTKEKDITIYAKAENKFVVIDGVEVPYEIYEKKKRIDELKKLLGGNESA